MKLLISNKNLCLLSLFLCSFQVSAQIPGTVQFNSNNLAQELIQQQRDVQLEERVVQRQMGANAALEEQPFLAQIKALETQELESYVRANVSRCLQAQLPRGFCSLLMQPPWNQP